MTSHQQPVAEAELDAAAEAVRILADASPLEDAEAGWAEATQTVVRLLVHRAAIARGYDAPTLPVNAPPSAMAAGCRALARIDVTPAWSAPEFGPVYERLLAQRPGIARERQGSWYTPPEIAIFMNRIALDTQLDRLAKSSDPGDMIRVLVIDPACGAGIYPLMAARHIATRYAARLFGEAPAAAVRAVMPEVLTECIFGIDIDPIAVELTRAALWLEVGDREPWGFMDRNIISGNALALDEPPAYTERAGEARPRGAELVGAR